MVGNCRFGRRKFSVWTQWGEFDWPFTHRSRTMKVDRFGCCTCVVLFSMAICFLISEHSSGRDMGGDDAMRSLIPRCFRRKKAPPTPETAGNIFEQRMKHRLKKQNKRSVRAKRVWETPLEGTEFATFDLLAVKDPPLATRSSRTSKQEPPPHILSWDSAADTCLSPPSSVGAEAGGVVGTTHMRSLGELDSDNSSRYTAQLRQQEISQEAAFRLYQLAHLDMRNSTPSFVYQVPRHSARKWSMATTQGSTGEQLRFAREYSSPKACPT